MSHLLWNIDPVLLDLGFLKIRWYGAMFAAAFLFSYSVMQWIYRREGRNEADLDTLLWYMVIGIIGGARLGHTLIYDPVFYLSHPWKILAIWEGGLASHGGIAGILLALYFYTRKTGDSYWWLLDRLAFPCTMSGSFIRIGNFFNSEIIGTVTNEPWGVIFPRVDNLPRHPVQLYEAACYIAIFLIGLAVYRRTWNQPVKGLLCGLMLTLVFVARIAMEFFKTEQAMYDTGLPLTTGQLLSIPFLLVGLGITFWSLKNWRAAGRA